MKYKFVFFLFIVVLALNAYIFLNRGDYVFKKQLCYIELYPVVSSVAVKFTEKINDSSIRFNLLKPLSNPVKWYTLVNETKDSQVVINPVLILKNNTNSYTISSPSYNDSISLNVEYAAAKNGGQSFIGKYKSNEATITSTEIRGQDYIFDKITKIQHENVLKILKDSMLVDNKMSTEEKIKFIFIYLHKRIFYQRGLPDSSTLNLDTFKQYEAALAGKKIWCGIYTNIFNMFGAGANVKCRFLEIKNNFGDIQGSTHEVSEYFCSEKNQWVAVDLMYNILETKNANGHILNTVEVKNVAPNDSTVKVLQINDGRVVQYNFSNIESSFFDFYGKDKDIYLYNTTAEKFNGGILKKIKNNIYKTYWYGFYSDTRMINNLNFYLKITSFFLLFVFGFLTLTLVVLKIKNHDRI